jgi:putative ABC transport system permease protein
MLKNYFVIAWRNLLRNKSFSILNIAGLAIGMASAMIILLWVSMMVSVDRGHAKIDRLYAVMSNDNVNGAIRTLTATPEIMATTLKKDYPDIEGVSRTNWTRNLFTGPGNVKLLSTGNTVDSDFLSMFSFPLLYGNVATALHDPQGIVITRRMAKKLFNSEDVVGRTITMGRADVLKITGVMKDLQNTMFDYIDYFIPYAQQGAIDQDWSDIGNPTFVLLKPNTRLEAVNNKLKDIIPRHTNGHAKTEEFLYPVSQLNLYGQFENGKPSGGEITVVRTFSLIALFILVIACINFMNLSTARSERRAKEVGIRKVAGALRRSLLFQFLGESILIAMAAGILAVLLVELTLPAFNRFTRNELRIDYSNPACWMAVITFILFAGILAGSYPAFVLSSFKPVAVLKGRVNSLMATMTPRKVLVVFQFSIAIVLIISTIIITRQLKYGRDRQSGYDKDHLISVAIYNDGLRDKFDPIKRELLASGAATSVSLAQSPLIYNWSSGLDLKWQGKDPNLKIQIDRYGESGDLVKTAGMRLVEGRDIDPINFPTDSTACLINESALEAMKFKNPIGQPIGDDRDTYHVVGVIKDFILESPYQPIKPMIIRGPRTWLGAILIRANGQRPMTQNIAAMEKIFRQYNPAYPFEFTFADEDYATKFQAEQFISRLSILFAGLVIIISCLGLFGLATYMAQARIKEIGIRKVLGASAANITLLLSRDFVRLVALAILIATPVAWWAMNNWLSAYRYRISIGWDIFLVSGATALLIAITTVAYQSIRAAIANPVKSLRSE